MNDDSIYWMLGIVALGAIISIIGALTGRNLPKKQKSIRTRKSAALGLALIMFSLPIFTPFVSSYSQTKYLDELKPENLNSVEEIAKFDKEQTKNIERLKAEVQNLREELYAVNR